MLALLKKEWIVGSRILVVSFILHFILLFTLTGDSLSLTMAIVFALINIRNLDGYDDKNNYQLMIQSMPISRKEAVTGKILFNFLHIFSYVILVVLFNALLPNFQANSFDVILMATAFSIFLAVGYQFLYVVFGPKFMTYALLVLFLIMILFGWIITNSSFGETLINSSLSHTLKNLDRDHLAYIISAICIVLSAIFFTITLKSYEQKDL